MKTNNTIFKVKEAVRRAIEKKRILGTSVVVYDRKTKKICNLNADGTKTLISNPLYKKRYSERLGDTKYCRH
jgi:hypothetical protein